VVGGGSGARGVQAQIRAFEERVDRRFEGTDRRIDALDSKMSR